jgi:hypothetical protein
MAHSLLMHREGGKLVPSDALAEEDLLSFSDKRPVMVEVRHPRSLPQHRLLFGLIRKAARACPTPITENALRQWLTVRTGHVDVLPLGFGKSFEAPRSWAFDKMDGEEFRRLFDDVVHLILTEVAPSLPASFADEFLAVLDSSQGGSGANNPRAEAA